MTQGKFKVLPIAVAISCMFSGIAAAADAGIEEVIVTARKTEESVQVVPISVTALSAESLTKAAITDIKDVHVPGLYITSDTQGGQVTFAIRAAKQGNGTSDTVTAYVGDMPVVTNYAISHMMYDMQSISVLKGPQGTLFGANSTGGAIIFRPNTPSDSFEGYADVGVGNYNLQSFQGMVNLPVNEVLQLRIAGEVVDRDKGYVKNHRPAMQATVGTTPLSGAAYPNMANDLDTDKHESVRLGIRLKPSADWEHNLTFEYFHEDDKPHPEIPAAYLPGTFLFGPTFLPVNWSKYSNIITGDPKNVSFGGVPQGTFRKAKIWDGIWTANYSFSDTASFKSVLAYQDDRLDYSTDNDMSPWPVVNGRTAQEIKQWSWEPSVDWKTADGRLRNKTGLFFSDKKWDWHNSYGLVGLPFDPTAAPLNVPAAFAGVALANINNNLPTEGHQNYHRVFQSHAIYTQFSYDLSKELTATLGLRYSWDKGTYSSVDKQTRGLANLNTLGQFFVSGLTQVCTYGPNAVPPGPLPGYATYNVNACTAADTYKSQAPSFTFTLEDKYAENSMVYATLRGGYLLGGFNNQISQAAAPFGLFGKFKPEKVVDFETGLKSDWSLWNRPIRTNLAVFYGNYKDQQRFQNATINGTQLIGTVNAGASNFYGFDLDVTYEPTDSLELNASWNHVETEYTRFSSFISGQTTINGVSVVGSTVDLSGTEMAQAPKDVVNLSATVKWPLSSGVGKLSSTLSYFWTDKTRSQDTPTQGCSAVTAGTTNCIAFNPALDFRQYDQIPAYDLWNFSTQWKGILGSNFDANFWIKNLMDKKYWTSTGNQMLVFGYANRIYGFPRTFGLNVRYNF